MIVVADTGPLVAAAHTRDEANALAAELLTNLGSDLIVLDTVATETDHLMRSRVGAHAGRAFLASLTSGQLKRGELTQPLLRRAAELDARYADLDLGLADASVMAYAEHHRLPILTFDFEHFRATRPARGYWKLVIDETRYRAETGN